MKIHFRSLGKVVEYEGIGYQAGQQVTLTEGEAWALNKALADAIRSEVMAAEVEPDSTEAAKIAAETQIVAPQRAAAAPKKTPLDIYVEETLALQIMCEQGLNRREAKAAAREEIAQGSERVEKLREEGKSLLPAAA